jgi:hypothetical protein
VESSRGGIRTSRGFFYGRDQADVDLGPELGGIISYPNVSRSIGLVLSSGIGNVTLTELGTTLGIADLYDLIEIVTVDAHNRRVVNKALTKKD